MMRRPVLIAILIASLASVATSSPDGTGEASRRWYTSSDWLEHAPTLEVGEAVVYQVRARLHGDLTVLDEEHHASVSMNAFARGDDADPPTLTIEASVDGTVVGAETLRRGNATIRLPLAMPTDECPRERGATCTYEIDVRVELEGAPAEVEWTAFFSAYGTLERAAAVNLAAELEVVER
jgi:hypothetical protein